MQPLRPLLPPLLPRQHDAFDFAIAVHDAPMIFFPPHTQEANITKTRKKSQKTVPFYNVLDNC